MKKILALLSMLLAFPAAAATLYSQNFDGLAAGVTPPSWVAYYRNASNFVTGTTGAVSSPNALQFGTDAFGVVTIQAAGTSCSTCRMTFTFKWTGALPTPAWREDTNGVGYVYFNGTIQQQTSFFGVSGIQGCGFPPISAAAGDTMRGEIATTGTRMELRYWNVTKGQSRPTTPGCAVRNASYSAGFFGFFLDGTNLPPIDDVVITDDFDPTSGAAQTVTSTAYTDPGIFFSPYTWAATTENGTAAMQAPLSGAYLKTKVYGTRFGISVLANAQNSTGDGITPTTWLRAVIDGKSYDLPMWASGSFTFADNLTASTYHNVTLFVRSALNLNVDRWTTPVVGLKVVTIDTDGSGVLQAPTLHPKRMLVIGDSLCEGTFTDSLQEPAGDDATATYPRLMALGLDAEYGMSCHAAGRLAGAAGDSSPGFNTSWSQVWSGKSRLDGTGKLVPQPDYIVVNSGTNGGDAQSDYASSISLLRAAAPTAIQLRMTPLSGAGGTFNTASVAAARAAGDKKVYALTNNGLGARLNIGFGAADGSTNSLDGIHYTRKAHALYGAQAVGEAYQLMAADVPRRFNVTVH